MPSEPMTSRDSWSIFTKCRYRIRPSSVRKMAAESTKLFCNTSQEKAELWYTALEKVKLHSKLYIKATGAQHFYLGRVILFT